MIIFFGIIFLVVGMAVFFLFRFLKQTNLSSQISTVITAKSSLLGKLNFGQVKNPEIQIPVSEEELNSLFSNGIQSSILELHDITIQINELNLEILAQAKKPIRTPVQILARPVVNDDKIKLAVTNVKIGRLPIPGLMRSGLQNALNGVLDKNFQNLYENYRVTEIKLEKDEMIIFGKLK